MAPTVITHTDSDGLLSLATFLKTLPADSPCRIFFSSPTRLFSTIAASIDDTDEENELLYVFDLTGTREALIASLVFDKAVWVDHHVWEGADVTHERLEVRTDPESPSAAQLVAKHFNITSGFETVAEEIDMNKIVSAEAKRLRDLVDAYKGRDDWETTSKSLQELARKLAANGISEVMKEEHNALLEEYGAYAKKIEDRAIELLKIEKVGELKVAIVDTNEGLPVFLVNRRLMEHPEAPFDVVMVLNRASHTTRCEFRTQKDYDVLKLARWLGGGGHHKASGAQVEKRITIEELLKIMQ
jgi:nanoRNase/pAp phosphatase (c-di-AMP/oligoRNAs hydrolase)